MLGNDVYALGVLTLIVWVILIYSIVARPSRSASPAWRRPLFRNKRRLGGGLPFDIQDVGQQLHAVMAASFEKRRLLSPAEYRTFKIVETELAASRSGYRVFAQTSLGEVLASGSENGFRSINSKRVDILIVDGGGWPILAVEYQGGGHFQGNAAARDAVKKEALRKAGIRYVEVYEGDDPQQIRLRVRDQLGWRTHPITEPKVA
jgi:hypothetical protein